VRLGYHRQAHQTRDLAGAGRDSFRRKGVSSLRDQMVILAARSDQAAFGPGQLSETQAQMFWHGLSQLKNQLSLGFSRMRRLWAKVTPRSLRHRSNLRGRGQPGCSGSRLRLAGLSRIEIEAGRAAQDRD